MEKDKWSTCTIVKIDNSIIKSKNWQRWKSKFDTYQYKMIIFKNFVNKLTKNWWLITK